MGTRSTGRPASSASAVGSRRPRTAATPDAASPADAAPTARAPFTDVTTSQSNSPSRPSAPTQLDAAVGRLPHLGQRNVVDDGAVLAQPIGQPTRPLLGQHDPAAGQRGVHHAPTATWARTASAAAAAAAESCLVADVDSLAEHDPVTGQERVERSAVAVSTDGKRAAGTELAEEGPFDHHRVTRRRVVDRGERRGGVVVALTTFDRDAPLSDRRHESRGVQAFGDVFGEAEHLERRDRHHDRAAVRDLLEATGDVAAQLDEREVRAIGSELSSSAHGACGDGCTARQPRRASPR